jgi:hypothetical protein
MFTPMTHVPAAQRLRDAVALRALGSAVRVSPPQTWAHSPIGFGGDRGQAAP